MYSAGITASGNRNTCFSASVVKGLSGSIKSAYQMVYAKSRLHTSDRIVCASEDCQTETNLDTSKNGVIAVTKKGYPVSKTGELDGITSGSVSMKNTIAGAVDLGISWGDYDNLDKTDGTNPADWIILSNDGGYAFVPKSAPSSAKTDKTKYSSSLDDSTSTCGVFYKATDDDKTPVVRVFVKGC